MCASAARIVVGRAVRFRAVHGQQSRGARTPRGTGPYFYLPKLENHLEARLWNDVFVATQDALGMKRGTIKATVLIETVLAAFEMDAILFELREHCAGLNCGRWDYIFSFIKKFRNRPEFLLPDRAVVTMDRHFLKSYVDLLIQTCHRRGALAMGGMAAQIPIRKKPPGVTAVRDETSAAAPRGARPPNRHPPRRHRPRAVILRDRARVAASPRRRVASCRPGRRARPRPPVGRRGRA